MPTLYVTLLTALLVGAVSFGLGHRLASGACAESKLVEAQAARDERDAYLNALRVNLEAEQRRAVVAAAEAARRRAAVEGVMTHVENLPARPACELDDAERVQLRALYREYGYTSEAGAAGLPGPVRAAPVHEPEPGGVGGEAVSVGR